MALVLLLYKHVVNALRRAKMIDLSKNSAEQSTVTKNNTGVMLVAVVILATAILLALVLKGVI